MSNPETTETASDLHVSASVCVVGVLAEALAQHHVVYGPFGAECHFGDWHEAADSDDWAAEFAAHQASVVAALPNIAIVELPEPDTNDKIQHWAFGDISATEGGGLVWADLEPTVHGHETAHIVAANLLAAARAAGGKP